MLHAAALAERVHVGQKSIGWALERAFSRVWPVTPAACAQCVTAGTCCLAQSRAVLVAAASPLSTRTTKAATPWLANSSRVSRGSAALRDANTSVRHPLAASNRAYSSPRPCHAQAQNLFTALDALPLGCAAHHPLLGGSRSISACICHGAFYANLTDGHLCSAGYEGRLLVRHSHMTRQRLRSGLEPQRQRPPTAYGDHILGAMLRQRLQLCDGWQLRRRAGHVY